jgi:hypothetical protein
MRAMASIEADDTFGRPLDDPLVRSTSVQLMLDRNGAAALTVPLPARRKALQESWSPAGRKLASSADPLPLTKPRGILLGWFTHGRVSNLDAAEPVIKSRTSNPFIVRWDTLVPKPEARAPDPVRTQAA